jgi:hypothetical protein
MPCLPVSALVAIILVAASPAGAADDVDGPQAPPPPVPSPLPEPPPGTNPWDTFAYEHPPGTFRLRLALEEASMMAVAFVGYLIQDPPLSYPGVVPPTVGQKLTFAPQSWYFDADAFATNFGGHAAAGALYYAVARSNRVGVLESFAWTLATSLAWELLEYKEPVSINDMVVTSVGGTALGEALTQLSGWFDRSGTDGVSRALAWIFSPPRKLHDWIDKATPLRDPAWLGWHEFHAAAGLGLVWQDGVAHAAVGLELGTRLFRAPGYGEAGDWGFGFADGNVSRIDLSLTISESRTLDFLLDTETALLGWYVRSLKPDGDGLRGWDLFLGGTVGYSFGSHVWWLDPPSGRNQLGLVRAPGLDVRFRAFAGEFEVELALDAAFCLAGVEPLTSPPPEAPPPGRSFPPVFLAQGYYYGIGVHLAPSLELRLGPAGLGAAVRADAVWSLPGPYLPPPADPVASFADGLGTGAAWFRLRFHEPSVELALRATWWERWGTVEGVTTRARQTSLQGSFSVGF